MAKDTSAHTPAKMSVVTREYTIHLHKYLYGRTFKRRAPTAIKVIRKFAQKAMKTTDIRIDPKLNKAVWGQGVRSIPHRIRIRLSRRRNEEDEAEAKFYTIVTYVPVSSFKGLLNETVEA